MEAIIHAPWAHHTVDRSAPADTSGSKHGGSDALIDALVAHGSPETIYTQINGHLTAGANHIGIQVFTEDPTASPVQAFRSLAEHRPAQ